MSSLFDVGKSAVQSYRQSLAVTGQNIANINTDGYKRRAADLEEVSGSQGGITSLANQSGLGVRVADIRRAFDGFLLGRTNSTNASYQKMDIFLDNLRQLENTLLPSEGGLNEQMGRFFSAMSDVAAAPTDIASRSVAIETSKSLVSSFNGLAAQLDQLQNGALEQTKIGTSSLSILAKELASINARILSSGQSGQTPNSLLDLRDRTISEMSALTSLSVEYSDVGSAKVSIGSSGMGPVLVDNSTFNSAGHNIAFGKLQVTVGSGAVFRPTSQVDAGSLAGAVDAYSLIDEVKNDLDNLAFLMSSAVNAQHENGIDLNGNTGKPMFSVFGLSAELSPSASTDLRVQIDVSDPNLLPSGPLTARYDRTSNVWTLNGEGLATPITGRTQLQGQGFDIVVTGTPRDNDFFEITRGSSAAANISLLLTKPQEIAASGKLSVEAAVKNTSDASVVATSLSNVKKVDPFDISKTLKNSLSPIEATNFLSSGLVSVIPAGTPSAKIASFEKQSSAKFQLQGLVLNNLQQLSFQRTGSNNNGPHTFDIKYGTAYPNASSSAKWTDSAELADLLNSGVLKSTANVSMVDLGIRVSGKGGNLTLVSGSGNFVTTGSGIASMSAGVGTVQAAISDAVAASDFQVFTREGRHIAGTALTTDAVTNLLSTTNGFSPEAVYRGDYLNREDNAYRGISLNVSRNGGLHLVESGSNGSLARSVGGTSAIPANNATADTLKITMANSETASIAVSAGASAKAVAATANKTFNKLGVSVEARLVTELYGFASGTVEFEIESENRMPVKVSADVTSENLTNLASSINQTSGSTGVSAYLSTDKARLILESSEGEDIVLSELSEASTTFSMRIIDKDNLPAITPIGALTGAGSFGTLTLATKTFAINNSSGEGVGATADVTLNNGNLTLAINEKGNGYKVGDTFTILGSALGGTDGANNLTITVGDLDNNAVIEMGSVVGGERVKSARFSGQLFYTSSESFTLQQATLGVTKISAKDENLGGMADIKTNLNGDIKTIDYEVNSDIDESDSSHDGNGGTAAAATYHLSIPSSTSSVKFSATVNASSIRPLGKSEVNTALINALRQQAPLSSLSASNVAASKQVTTYGFAGSEAVVSGADTAATNGEDVTTAIMNAVNSASLGVVASKAFVGGTRQIVLTSTELGEAFTVEEMTFTDAANSGSQGSLGLVSTSVAKKLPADGVSVSITFDDGQYLLTMKDNEVVVTGGEPGRLNAFFDADQKLQVFGGGTLSGAGISVTSDSVVAGNSTNAALFGIDASTTRFAGQTQTLANGMANLNLKFNGANVAVALSNTGAVTVTPTTSGLTARWESATSTTGRLVLEFNAIENTLDFTKPSDRLGFKLTNHSISVVENQIRVKANDGSSFKVDAAATSIAGSMVEMSNLAQEDLLVIFTGAGARSLGATFDEPVPKVGVDEIKLQFLDDGSTVELFDLATGHSIATRTLDNKKTSYDNTEFTVLGNAKLSDEFVLKENKNGGGGASNLQKIMDLQFSDVGGAHSGGFQKVFGTIVAELGESVRSGEITLASAEAARNAAEEAEAEFSGVNLDEEAAALLEFQQAYQASARILSTARELFQALIEVV
jgi:flagellar hook-associated protein FlgK